MCEQGATPHKLAADHIHGRAGKGHVCSRERRGLSQRGLVQGRWNCAVREDRTLPGAGEMGGRERARVGAGRYI
jgi:hypothetical protein